MPRRMSVTPPAIETFTPLRKRDHAPSSTGKRRARTAGSIGAGTRTRRPFVSVTSTFASRADAFVCAARGADGSSAGIAAGTKAVGAAAPQSPCRYSARQRVKSARAIW